MHKKNRLTTGAVSTVVGTLLIIILILSLVSITIVLFTDVITRPEETVYVVPEVEGIKTPAGDDIIRVTLLGGEPFCINRSGGCENAAKVSLTLTTPEGTTESVRPDKRSADTMIKPGDLLYIYHNNSHYQASGNIPQKPGSGLCGGTWKLCMIDDDADVLISDIDVVISGDGTDFGANIIRGKAPLIVQFTGISQTNPASWKWSFGDSTASSGRNPVHTYPGEGIYTVSLTTTGEGGNSHTVTKKDYVSVSPALHRSTLTVIARSWILDVPLSLDIGYTGAFNGIQTTPFTLTKEDAIDSEFTVTLDRKASGKWFFRKWDGHGLWSNPVDVTVDDNGDRTETAIYYVP